MKISLRILSFSIFTLLLVLFIGNVKFGRAAVMYPTDAKIATVLGQDILYKDIVATNQEISQYALSEPNEKLPEDVVKHNVELLNLEERVNAIIIPHLQNVFHIEITTNEIDTFIKTYHALEHSSDQDIDKTKQEVVKVIQAFEAMYEDNVDAETAYDKYLRNVIPKSEWEHYKDHYNDRQKIHQEIQDLKSRYQELSLLTAQKISDQVHEQVKNILQLRKLQAAILNELSIDDPIMQSAVEQYESGPQDMTAYEYEKVHYRTWWEKMYKKDVEVHDESFDSIFDLLTKSVMLYPPFEKSVSSQSESSSTSTKNLQPSRHGAPPPINTTVFNEGTIENLIANIEYPQNVMLLEYGYFAGHKEQPFSTNEGFIWLSDALDKTKVGDLRWFLIQSVRGFGAFHAEDVLNDYGRDAYQAIFDNAALATTPREQYVVRQSIRDMVFSIATTLDTNRFLHEPKLDALLLKAWQINQQLITTAPTNISQQPIDWARAIKKVHAQDIFTSITETTLRDTAHPPNFSMLKLAVVVVQDKDAPRAIELLKTAQSKLPPDDYGNQKWLYQTWTQLITGKTSDEQPSPKVTDKTQLAALVEMREDQISYTGTGYADLLELYWRLGQNDKAADVMKVIQQPGVRAEEKIDVAKVLLMPPRDIAFSKDTAKQMQAQGVDLLQTYLATASPENPPNPLYKGELDTTQSSPADKLDGAKRAGEPRPYLLSVRNQLQAHYLLGRYYMRQDMITEAGKALQTGDLKPPFHSSESDGYYDQIVQLRAELEKKLAGVEGVR